MFDLGFPRDWSTLKKLIWLKVTQAAAAVLRLVTGSAPITLTNALAHGIKSLTQFGKCVQSTTPTPDAPVDIVCNNGTLTMVDDELPAAYKRVLGFSCDNNAMWEISGFKLKGSDTVRISFSVNAACNVFGCYQGADATDNYDLYVSTSPNAKYFRYGGGTYLSAWSSDDLGERFDVIYTPNGSQGMPQDSTWSPLTFTSANNLLIGATTLTGSSSKLKGNLYGSIVVDGRLKLIPCERVSDHTLGYYDTYTATFFAPYEGFDGAVSLGYDGSHYSLTVVGTPEVLTVRGINLCNPAYYQGDGWYVGANNTVTKSGANGTLLFPCKPNTTYSWWHTAGAGGCRAFELPTDTVTLGQEASWAVGNPAYADANVIKKCTTSADAKLLCVLFGRDAENVGRTIAEQLDDFMLVEGDITTATNYEPYVAPQTVNDVPMLLSVGDYADEGEIISGIKTGKVGVKVFDGTETPTAMSTAGAYRFTGASNIESLQNTMVLCTHYKPESPSKVVASMDDLSVKTNATANNTIYFKDTSCETAADLQAKFAALYAAGTPVIVIYPLAEETTEQTTPHALRTSEGTVIIDVTSNVDPVELEVEYYASA